MAQTHLILLMMFSLYFSVPYKSLAEGCQIRNIYLNGTDITGAVDQELKKVDLHIDQDGHIYISAPQYQVFEEDHFLPLSHQNSIPGQKTDSIPIKMKSTAKTKGKSKTKSTTVEENPLIDNIPAMSGIESQTPETTP